MKGYLHLHRGAVQPDRLLYKATLCPWRKKKSMQASLLWMWIKHIYQELFMALCFQQISKNECSMHGAKFIPAMHSLLCIVLTTCGSKLKDLIGLCDERDSAH